MREPSAKKPADRQTVRGKQKWHAINPKKKTTKAMVMLRKLSMATLMTDATIDALFVVS